MPGVSQAFRQRMRHTERDDFLTNSAACGGSGPSDFLFFLGGGFKAVGQLVNGGGSFMPVFNKKSFSFISNLNKMLPE